MQVSAAEQMNWLEFHFNMGWIPETEIRNLIKSLEEKRRYYRLPNGSLLPLDSAELQDLSRFLEDTGLLYTDILASKISIPLVRGLHLVDHDFSVLKLDKPVRQLLDNLRNPDNLDFPIPAHLTNVLRDYQKLGYQWLKTLGHYGFGGILADDMGLGKTLQSIAFICSVLPEIRQRRIPALVISPGSLVYNWRNELRKFAPGIRVLIADGSQTERAEKMQRLADADVVLTSYPLLLRDVGLYAKHSFHTLILDEAQAFKKPYDADSPGCQIDPSRLPIRFDRNPCRESSGRIVVDLRHRLPGIIPGSQNVRKLDAERGVQTGAAFYAPQVEERCTARSAGQNGVDQAYRAASGTKEIVCRLFGQASAGNLKASKRRRLSKEPYQNLGRSHPA